MANLALVFDLLAKDGASGVFRNVGDSAERAGKQTSTFGTAMSGAMKLASGALLGAGLVQGFQALYNAADESRKIGALTGQVIKTTGAAANVSAKQVGDLAAAIAKKTGVDDEAIQSGQNLLLTFTNIKNQAGAGNDIFSQTTQIMTDMSVALGTDASGSAIQLGKALNDPIKGVSALTRVGVSFTAQQKDQIKTLVESGDVLGAQKIILAELGREFGGAAEAASTPLGKLQQRVGDLAEKIGGYLVPMVDKGATFFNDKLLPALQDVGGFVAGVGIPALQALGTAVGAVADVFNALPGPLQAGVIAFGAFALLKGPVGGAMETIALKGMYLKDALGGAVTSVGGFKGAMSTLAGAFTPVNIGIGAAVALLPALIESFKALTGNSDTAAAGQRSLAQALRETNGVIDDNARAAAKQSLISEGLVDVLDRAGVSSRDAIDGLLGNADAQNRVDEALKNYLTTTLAAKGPLDQNTVAAGEAQSKYEQLGRALGMSKEEAEFFADSAAGVAGATGDAAVATDVLTTAADDNRAAMSEAKSAIDDYKLSLDILTGGSVSMLQVESQLQDAIAAGSTAIKEMGGDVLQASGALNLQSENGRKAADVLLDVRNSANDYIATMIQQGATSEQVTAKDAELRAAFIATANQMGITGQNAETLADQILGIPGERNTTITADTTQATGAVNNLQTLIDGLRGRTVDIVARAIMPDLNGSASGSGRPGLAFGGEVPGWSPHDRADNIPIMGTAGEFMQPIPAVRKYGKGFMESVRSGRFPKELAQGFADGGLIGAPVSIQAELDASAYNGQMNGLAQGVIDRYEPVQGFIGALQWAREQVGKPYVWGGVGPGGFDCSGFMSAITNVIRGRSPYSRVGSTASFPWAGFGAGSGLFTIGSTPNAGGGIGHMAGTLLGVNVESTGGVGVKVGGSARGAFDSLFSEHGALKFHNGGIVPNLGMPDVPALLAPGETVRTTQQEAALRQPAQFVGNLYLDSGELLGIVRGEATQVVAGALTTATNQGRYH